MADISLEAVDGGSGGGSPDPISRETAFLFQNFAYGTLGNFVTFDATSAADSAKLQQAIWALEQEIDPSTNQTYADNEYVVKARIEVGLTNAWITLEMSGS